MNDIIKKIIAGEDIEKIFSYVLSHLYQKGPISTSDLEILSYLALYRSDEFEQHKEAILNYMAVFYKDTSRKTLKDVIFGQYRRHIYDTYNKHYTPVQVDIVRSISKYNCFSFSAPTSTGKSFVFIDKINASQNDVVVVVPSRALINEYYLRLTTLIPDKTINILTFIDKVNTKHARRNIFIVTPERCRELFKQKDLFQIDLFLFDEAQLSNEDSKRGLYFDSIVRRCQKSFPESKFIFAHPFVKNPGSQIEKNHFDQNTSFARQYVQKNVGQMFLCKENNWEFSHFGIDVSVMGRRRQAVKFDPIERAINNNGSVLFYVSKTKIYNQDILTRFDKYIQLCTVIKDAKVDKYIDLLKQYTGGDTSRTESHYSLMLDLLRRGIVIHHGSLPLQTRIIIEQFTRDGFCRICFATSTLEQGINMPFEVVYLDRLEGSKPLSVKNLIGRAGRSSTDVKFDFGYVIINSRSRMSNLRRVMSQDEVLDTVSMLEKTDLQDDDLVEFREAILNGTYSDQYNLTEKELAKLTANETEQIILNILNALFLDTNLVPFVQIDEDLDGRLNLFQNFERLYGSYLGRELNDGESNVFYTALKIIFWKINQKTFKNICWYRYAYASRTNERELLASQGLSTGDILASFVTGYQDIPDKTLNVFSMFGMDTKAVNVQYDLIMYDTYDYIDKLIGFKLSDIFYAAFEKYFEKYSDSRADKLAKLIKYGTDRERDIWMLRYGMSFEDIQALDEHIASINAEEIVFNPSIQEVPDDQKEAIKRFL